MKALNKLKKIIFFAMLILLIIIAIYIVLIFIPNKNNQTNLTAEKTIKYNYITYSRDSKLYKEIFDKLEKLLNSDSVDNNKYAEYIGELFIIDFYTLENKNSKNDIGGIQYIKDDFKDNFKLNASNTIYKYIKNNYDGKRNQELPSVDKIELISVKESNYEINKISYSSYTVELKWEYKKDLGYEKSAVLTIINEDNKLYIVEKK